MKIALKNIVLPLAEFTLQADVEATGRVTTIFGPSGAGKTSLLEMVSGLRTAKSAFIQLDEQVLVDTARGIFVPPHQRQIGYVPQDLALFPHLSLEQNLKYGFNGGDQTPFSFDRVCETLEIQSLLTRSIRELSGGEKQRVALARALLASPRLLLLDEPLASLDAPLKDRIIPYLMRIRDVFKIPMLCVTHDRTEALALADDIFVLDRGRILQSGPVLDVFNRPANAEVAKIVGVETIQAGRVVNAADGLATVCLGGVSVSAVSDMAAGTEVLVCVRGEDVTLQRETAGTSSVRNRLVSRVVSLRTEGALVRAELDAGFPLFALVTRLAAAELDLREDTTVTALIKAQAVHLVGR